MNVKTNVKEQTIGKEWETNDWKLLTNNWNEQNEVERLK